MEEIDINNFYEERECKFKNEHYSVRDNGAICRHQRPGKKKRKLDNEWTFGNEQSKNSYLLISNIRVHRIIAIAFHGEPPEPTFVVDHIDTNCRNNRPENLRWLSRLDNAIKNPVTIKKIEYHCGSIEAFIKDPSMLHNINVDPSISWMRTVTKEEAENSFRRMKLWSRSKKSSSASDNGFNRKSAFEKRVYKPLQKWEAGLGRIPELNFALTPWCARYAWIGEPYFPSCPQELVSEPINDYFLNLRTGALLSYCDNDEHYPKLFVVEAVILRNKYSILVLCERADSKWSIIGIELNDKNHFIHFHLGSYSIKNEADTAFYEKQESSNFWEDGYFKKWDIN